MVAKSNNDSLIPLAAVAILAVLALLVLPSFLLPRPELRITEQPLGATVPPPFRGTETFVYQLDQSSPYSGEFPQELPSGSFQPTNLTYSTYFIPGALDRSSGCVYFSSEQNLFCVDDYGRIVLNGQQQNASYFPDGFYIYQPWMLAVGDGWSWAVVYSLGSFPGANRTISIRTIGSAEVNGRPSFKVEITDSLGNASTIAYIDKYWRVLSRSEGLGGTVNLVFVNKSY